MTGNIVSGNTVTATGYYAYGGGIYATTDGYPSYHASTVMSNTVTANRVSATGQGSGIYFDGSSPGSILTNTIVGNTIVSPTTAIIGGLAITALPRSITTTFSATPTMTLWFCPPATSAARTIIGALSPAWTSWLMSTIGTTTLAEAGSSTYPTCKIPVPMRLCLHP